MADNSKITAANIDSIQICKKYKKDKKLAASVIWERFRFFFEQPKKYREYSNTGNYYTILHHLLSKYDFGFADIEEFNAEVKKQYEDMCLDFDTYNELIIQNISLILFEKNRERNAKTFYKNLIKDPLYLYKYNLKKKNDKTEYFKKRIYMSFSMPINETEVNIIIPNGEAVPYVWTKNNQDGTDKSSGKNKQKYRVYTQRDFRKICDVLFNYMTKDEEINKHIQLKKFIQDNYCFNNRKSEKETDKKTDEEAENSDRKTDNNNQLYIPVKSKIGEVMNYYYQMLNVYDDKSPKKYSRSKIHVISNNQELLEKVKKQDPLQKSYNGLLHEFLPALTAFLILIVKNHILRGYNIYNMSDEEIENVYINTYFLENLKK